MVGGVNNTRARVKGADEPDLELVVVIVGVVEVEVVVVVEVEVVVVVHICAGESWNLPSMI